MPPTATYNQHVKVDWQWGWSDESNIVIRKSDRDYHWHYHHPHSQLQICKYGIQGVSTVSTYLHVCMGDMIFGTVVDLSVQLLISMVWFRWHLRGRHDLWYGGCSLWSTDGRPSWKVLCERNGLPRHASPAATPNHWHREVTCFLVC